MHEIKAIDKLLECLCWAEPIMNDDTDSEQIEDQDDMDTSNHSSDY